MTEPRSLMSSPAHRLQAGGLLTLSTPLPPGLPTDTVDARTFSHPCFPGRPVVRLVPDAQAEGAAQEMAWMGFSLTGHADDLAVRKRQALGFPGRALLIDPPKAGAVLERMDTFREEADRVATKPGHARDGFARLATEIEALNPAFLPSYWEEAGRAFIIHGNLAMAASCFDKARAAERAWSLPVESATRADIWLEFALAGALTVKALQTHGKTLATEGLAGFELFLDLCARRTQGGLKPWADMVKDLRRAAKAASLSPEEADRRIARALLGARALNDAPRAFWATLRPALLDLARHDPHIRLALLQTLPAPGEETEEMANDWLDLLEETGILGELADARTLHPRGGVAAWFSHFETAHQDHPRLPGLLRRLAPAMRAEAIPLQLFHDYWRGASAILLDLALSLDIPLAEPKPDEDGDPPAIDLDAWATAYARAHGIDLGTSDDEEDEDEADNDQGSSEAAVPAGSSAKNQSEPPTDLRHLCAHAPIRAALIRSVERLDSAPRFHRAAKGLASLAPLREEAATARLRAAQDQGLLGFADALERLDAQTFNLLRQEFPSIQAALDQIDPAAALRRTLNQGLFAELQWEAWERTLADHFSNEEPTVFGIPPAPGLANKVHAFVLSQSEVVARFDLVQIPDEEPSHFVYSEGQLFAGFHRYPKPMGVWSARPAEQLELANLPPSDIHRGLLTPSGALLIGARPIHPGDTRFPEVQPISSDGRRIWLHTDRGIQPLDPTTHTLSPPERPDWLQQGDETSWILPLPTACQGTTSRSPSGLYGLLCQTSPRFPDGHRYTNPGAPTAEPSLGIDFPAGVTAMELLVEWPGTTELRPLSSDWRGNPHLHASDNGEQILGTDSVWTTGWAHLPPLPFWCWLQARDLPASEALRALSQERAAALLQAFPQVSPPEPQSQRLDRLAQLFPEVTAKPLQEAMLAAIDFAVAAADRLHRLRLGISTTETKEAEEETPERVDDGDLSSLLAESSALPIEGDHGDSGHALLAAARYFSGVKLEPAHGVHRWEHPGQHLAAGLFFASFAEKDGRTAYADLLTAWQESGLWGARPDLRRLRLKISNAQDPFIALEPDSDPGWPSALPIWTRELGDHRYLVRCLSIDSDDGAELEVIEQAGAQGFELPAQATLEGEPESLHLPTEPPWLATAIARLREGPREVHPEDARALSAASGLPLPAATLLLGGNPRGSSWRKDRLGPALRARLNLKTAEVQLGVEALADLNPHEFIAALEELLSPDPQLLWSPPGTLGAALGALWARRFSRPTLSEDLLSQLTTSGLEIRSILEAFLAGQARYLRGLTYSVGSDAVMFPRPLPEPPAEPPLVTLDAASILADLSAAAWTVQSVPGGHPLRASLSHAFAELREAADEPGFGMLIGQTCSWDPKAIARMEALWNAFPGTPQALPVIPNQDPVELKSHNGHHLWRQDRWTYSGFHPAGQSLDGPLLKALIALDDDKSPLHALHLLRSPDMAALCTRAAATPEGAWDQDPSVSAPTLLAEVSNSLALTTDAARLYLQVLTLADPTRKNILRWNNWKPATYAAAETTLVERKLLTAGKRPRAGRESFIGGAWLPQKAPNLPIEAWKLPLYQVSVFGTPELPFPVILPLSPLGDLFHRAWQRLQSGDRP